MANGPEAGIHLDKIQSPPHKAKLTSLPAGLEERGVVFRELGRTPSILYLFHFP